jgi:hypothetical protein
VGGVPAGAGAVALNVTITGATAGSYLTMWPYGDPAPTTSNLNWAPNETRANAVTVKVGTGGRVWIYNAGGNVDVIVDVVGYYDTLPGDGFSGLAPARILDSRPDGPAVGGYTTPWVPATTRDVTVAGVAQVPTNATAVVLNATITSPTGGSYLTVWPKDSPKPTASNINWVPADTRANAVTVKVGTGGKVSVYNHLATVHVIFDIVGYFTTGSGKLFHPVQPVRVQDSRPATKVGAHATPWGPNASRIVAVGGVGGLPGTADSVLLNVTVTGTTGGSYLTVWPNGESRPTASSLNWGPGQTLPNAVTVKLGSSGSVQAYNNQAAVDVIMDAAGYYE